VTEGFSKLHQSLQYHIVNSLGFRELRPVQEATTAAVLEGNNVVVLAPTAGGKTEAAMFPLISQILEGGRKPVSVLYLSPIRALLNNQEPRVERLFGMVGRHAFKWHGDVSSSKRKRAQDEPPDILLTTPESLEVMFVSRKVNAQRFLGNLRAVVIDEVHAFAGGDRGAHLVALLERVVAHTKHDLQRIGLSATVGNPKEILRWMQGSSRREGVVINPPRPAGPTPDVTLDYLGTLDNVAAAIQQTRRWQGTKRLVFSDSRTQTEQLGAELKGRSVETYVIHSSLSADERGIAERKLAESKDCVIVATSALELGIDIGDLDHVVQVGCPPTVASFLQRMGRTGRRGNTASNYTFLTLERRRYLSLLQAAGMLRLWDRGYVESVHPPQRSYHVLAHQLMALSLQEDGVPEVDWWGWIGASSAFRNVSAEERQSLLQHMLDSKVLISDGVRLIFGPEGERLYGKKNFMALYSVFTAPASMRVLHGGNHIGFLDVVYLLQREGREAVFSLGGRSWKLKHIDWPKQFCFVDPSKEEGKSVWTGAPLDLGWELCQAMLDVLTSSDHDTWWSKRTKTLVDVLRDEHAFLRDPGLALVPLSPTKIEWWTFAGLRANGPVALELEARLGGRVTWDNLRITFQDEAGRSRQAISDELGNLKRDGLSEELALRHADRAARSQLSKFQPCLPRELEVRYLADRLFDMHSAAKLLGQEYSQPEVPDRDEATPDPTTVDIRSDHSKVKREKGSKKERGARDLTSTTSVIQREARLTNALERLFQPASEPSGRTEEAAARKEWEASLVLAAPAKGGLMLQTVPLLGLPRFVKRLEVCAGDQSRVVLASNLRSKTWRTPVLPGTQPYQVKAPGFEDELAEDLERLTVEGLPSARASAFRVEASGFGRALKGDVLSPGQTYRFLVPGGVKVSERFDPQPFDGWTFAEVEIPTEPEPWLSDALKPLGCQLARSALSAEWTGAQPSRYGETRGGDRFPIFKPGGSPILKVSGHAGGGPAWLFLAGGAELVRHELPQESPCFVELADLPEGRYVVEVTCESSAITGVHCPFELALRPASPPLEAAITLRKRVLKVMGTSKVRRDLTDLSSDELAFRLPPLWPVRVRWDGFERVELRALHADLEGELTGESIVSRLGPLWCSQRRGDVTFEFSDLGHVLVQHTRAVAPERIREKLQALWEERKDAVDRAGSKLDLVRSLWLAPVVTALGYQLRELPSEFASEAPDGTAPYVLVEAVRRKGGVQAKSTRAVILAERSTKLVAKGPDSLRAFAESLCEREQLKQAFLTDGLRWTVFELGRSLMPPAVDLVAATDSAEQFEAFLWTFLAEE
jgi:ATP-dependent helicase Lhr and Lhr-like helicase